MTLDMTQVTDYKNHCIDVCNSLLRGELSAVETYSQVIGKFSTDPQVEELKLIREEHVRSAEELRLNVISMGGAPEVNSGVWGAFANTFQAAANLIGDTVALASLIQGEEHGLSEFDAALSDQEVVPVCKDLIQYKLRPRLEEHIVKLTALKQVA